MIKYLQLLVLIIGVEASQKGNCSDVNRCDHIMGCIMKQQNFTEQVEGKEEKDGQAFVKVETDAILPCGIDVPTDNQTYETYTWTERAVFLLTAKEDQGNITITFVVESLKAKYSLDANYSLMIKNVDLDDTKRYTCSVGIFRDPETKDLIQKFEHDTELYVQDVPSKPWMPQIGRLKSRQVSVWWLASFEENNSPISSYNIQVRINTENWVLGKKVTTNIHKKNITTNMSLRPYTSYKLRIVAVNSIGESMPSEPSINFITPSEEPEAPPRNLLATSNTSSVIHITWDHPPSEKINGELKGYKIMYSEADKKVFSVITFERKDKTELDISGVKSYTEYIIQVAALNTEGPGPVAYVVVVTAEGESIVTEQYTATMTEIDTIVGITTLRIISSTAKPTESGLGFSNREIIVYSICAGGFVCVILLCIVCQRRYLYKQIYGNFRRYKTGKKRRRNISEVSLPEIPLEASEGIYDIIDESNMIVNFEIIRKSRSLVSRTDESYCEPNSNGYLTPYQPGDDELNMNDLNDNNSVYSESIGANDQVTGDGESTSSSSEVHGRRSSYLNPYQPIVDSADIHEYSFTHNMNGTSSSGSESINRESGYLNPYQSLVPDRDSHNYKYVLECSGGPGSVISDEFTKTIVAHSYQDLKSEIDTREYKSVNSMSTDTVDTNLDLTQDDSSRNIQIKIENEYLQME